MTSDIASGSEIRTENLAKKFGARAVKNRHFVA